jgi:branched-chain amino acid aminotransferase
MYYTPDTIIYHDGQFVKAKDASADLFAQTLHYGYGAFEGLRAYRTVHGTKIFKAHDHFERLHNSCRLAGIPLNTSVEELTQLSYQVLERNNLSDAYIRPLVYCGPNMSLTAPTRVHLMIAAWEWGRYLGDKLLNVCISSYQRPNPRSIRVEAKICGHYVNSILATTEAKRRGYDEALMLDMNGHVAEGPGANIFFEKNGCLHTPPAGSILPGITRQTVLDICHELDIPVEQTQATPEDLLAADSAFFCGTAAEVAGIASLEGHAFPKPWKKSLGSLVQEAYQCLVLDKSYAYVIV